MKYLEIEAVHLISASFGGYVALDFVLAYPEMVTALILAAPALGGYEFESKEMLEFFAAENEALEQGDLEKATELNLKMWVDGFGRSKDGVNLQVREQVRVMQSDIFSKPEIPDVEEKELTPPAIERLENISVPTLVIVGDKDVAEFQSISNLIARKVRNGRQITMQGIAHLPSMEKLNEFNQMVLDFVETGKTPENDR